MPRTTNYDGLKNIILRQLLNAYSPDKNTKLSDLTMADVERMIGFVQFLQEMHVRAVMGVLTMTTYHEHQQTGVVGKGGSKAFYECVMDDFKDHLQLMMEKTTKVGLLPFNPLEGVADFEATNPLSIVNSLLSELGIKLEHSDVTLSPQDREELLQEAQDAINSLSEPPTRH